MLCPTLLLGSMMGFLPSPADHTQVRLDYQIDYDAKTQIVLGSLYIVHVLKWIKISTLRAIFVVRAHSTHVSLLIPDA